jgi:hypothetical protein
MNVKPTVVTTNYRVAAVLPPTPEYRWNRNIHAGVLADNIPEAIEKFMAVHPESVIISVSKSSEVNIT